MREMIVVCVHDVKAGAYMNPIVVPTDLAAVRSFEQAVKEEGHQFNEHKEDYSLWRIGRYESESGKLIPETPVMLVKGFDVQENER